MRIGALMRHEAMLQQYAECLVYDITARFIFHQRYGALASIAPSSSAGHRLYFAYRYLYIIFGVIYAAVFIYVITLSFQSLYAESRQAPLRHYRLIL